MFQFTLEPEVPLLTVKRTGTWTLDTVAAYETELREKLAELHRCGSSTSFIIDIRSSGAQSQDVAEALRAMVARLGPLHAGRTAVVTSSGIAKLQAKRVADVHGQVFTSMVLARDWLMGEGKQNARKGEVFNEPSDANPDGQSVHVIGPSDVEVNLTPSAALESAKRIGDAALQVLRERASAPSRRMSA